MTTYTCGICIRFINPELNHLSVTWVDATLDLEGILDACDMIDLPIAIEDYEFIIFDQDGFGDMDVTGLNLEQINLIAKTIESAGCLAPIAWLQATGADIMNIEDYEEDFCGSYDSEKDYAIDLVDQCYGLTGIAEQYFDYERFASDLFDGVDYVSIEIDDELFVFHFG